MRLLIPILFIIFASLLPSSLAAWEPPKTLPVSTEDIELVMAEATKVSYSEPTGIWSFPDEDSEVAIIPISDSQCDIYKIVLIYDADLLPPPATIIGYLTPSASRNKWHAWLYASTKNDEMQSLHEFIATFSFSTQSEDASLVLEKAKSPISWYIHPLALIPFMRRILSINIHKSDSDKIPYGLHRKDSIHRFRWL